MTLRISRTERRARRSGRLAAGLAVAVAVGGLIGGPAFGEVEEVACDSLSVSVEGFEEGQLCHTGEFVIGGGDGAPFRLFVESVAAKDEGARLVVIAYAADTRSYVIRWSVAGFARAHDWFAATRNWGDTYEVEGFDAVPFEAELHDDPGFVPCIAFVRYLYRAPRSFGGYRRAVGGAYCRTDARGIAADEVRDVLQTLRF